MKTKHNRVWSLRQGSNDSDDDEDRYRRKEPGGEKQCCCCSYSLIAGIVLGVLICGAGIAPALIIFLKKPGDTTSTSTITTDSMGSSVTSTVSTTISTPAVGSTSLSSSSTVGSTSIIGSSSVSVSSTSLSSSSTVGSTSITGSSSVSVSSTSSISISLTTTTTATTTTTTAPWCTTKVTFDDIPGQSSTSGIIPNTYKNLNWTNAYYLNASTAPPSGYQIVLTSPDYVAYNPGGANVTIVSANGTGFAFNSIQIASAWRNYLNWTIQAYNSGILQLAAVISIQPINRTTVTCAGCSNYDTLFFSTSGGTPYPGLAENGTEFGFDDLCISFGY